ncbi:MAG: TlpA disulfide reductase family protein [Rhodocyclaceae bacterium]
MKRTVVLGAVALVATVAGVGTGYHFAAPASPEQAALTQLTRARLPDASGALVDMGQWRGKPMLVNFWGTWCAPCREEMPLLNDTAARYPGVQFVGIGIDEAAALKAYAATHDTRYPLLLGDANLLSLTRQLGNTAQALPFSVLIDARGAVHQVKLGAFKEAELQTALTSAANVR